MGSSRNSLCPVDNNLPFRIQMQGNRVLHRKMEAILILSYIKYIHKVFNNFSKSQSNDGQIITFQP